MAIERSRTETIRDFTVHTSGGVGQSPLGRLAGRVFWWGKGVPFLAMATVVRCRGRWEYRCWRGRRRATGEVLILGIG